MKSKFRKTLCFLLAICMIAALTACAGGTTVSSKAESVSPSSSANEGVSSDGTTQTQVADYLTATGSTPAYKPNKDITLKIVTHTYKAEWTQQDSWFWNKFVPETFGFQVEATQYNADNKKLAFATNDLPDLYINSAIMASDLMVWGEQEHQIVDMMQYVNETYMPNLAQYFSEHPDKKSLVVTPSGALYGIPYFASESDLGSLWVEAYNKKLADSLGFTVDKINTIDDFINMLRAMKNAGVKTPLGGSYATMDPTHYILTALGVTAYNNSDKIYALKNPSVNSKGEVVFPIADKEIFPEYVKIMKTLYDEELISKDFFSMDAAATDAEATSGNNAVLSNKDITTVFIDDTYLDWAGLPPLTSSINDKKVWAANRNAIRVEGYSVTNACKYPELCAIFADYWFDVDNYYLNCYGPMAGDPLCGNDISGWTMDETGTVTYADVVNQKFAAYTTNADYQRYVTAGWGPNTIIGRGGNDSMNHMAELAGLKNYDATKYDPTVKSQWMDYWKKQNAQYVAETYPKNAFFSADVAGEIATLGDTIGPYADAEAAKFITGARPLSEMDHYFEELEKMGVDTLIKYYKEYYEGLSK